MPATTWGWEITPEELERCILARTPELIVVNKPPRVVCHPSRYGPYSSFIGACREMLGVDRLHMPSRLDRETSGVMVFAIEVDTAKRLQHAVLRGSVRKRYHALLEGELQLPITVDQPIGRDECSEFFSRQTVRPDGQEAVTEFEPLRHTGGRTLVEARPRHGRRHQIRVHASWLGHPIVNDKLYGPDPTMMIDLIRNGFPLHTPRHMLHCSEVVFETDRGEERFTAPLPPDFELSGASCSQCPR